MAELLIEIFSEEIPARMQARAAADLKRLVTDGLVEAGLTYSDARAFATPRRLTLVLGDLPAASPDTREERRGPRVGAPDKAIEGFCRGAGVTRDQLETRDTPKGPMYFAVIEHKGRPAADIVAQVLDHTIRNFPWPKSMRWGAGSLRWVRPIHSILCLITDEAGANVVPLEIDGIAAGDTTRGHRFMAPGAIRVTGFADYAAKLQKAFVVLDAASRADHIRAEAESLAFGQGLELVEDRALLAEVAGLVEWPVVLMGQIDPEFAELPPEVLQTSMREHQKFFSLRDPKTGAIPRFVTVANIETRDHGATILAGNQKVLAARLSDARFFWENDLRVARADKMQPWLEALDHVTFHNRLGSQGARIRRMTDLARDLAPACGADPEDAATAARIAKADLESEMVYEFPELQGVMGRYYAREAGFPAAIADAARDHYAPQGPSDDAPQAPVSRAVALADKLDLLTGFWLIDERPTGSKDPFALRRAALGVIRILLAGDLRLPLRAPIEAQLLRFQAQLNPDAPDGQRRALEEIAREIARHGVFGAACRTVMDALGLDDHDDDLLGQARRTLPGLADDLIGFFHDRLKVHLKDEGIRHDVIDACLAMEGNDDLTLLVKRARALGDFLATQDGENLVLAYRRAANILAQAEAADGVEYSFGADVKFAEDPSEVALFAALDQADRDIKAALATEDFAAAMTAIARLRAPIDAFFEAVQINTDNQIVRRNRLNLLARIRDICLSVADLAKLEG